MNTKAATAKFPERIVIEMTPLCNLSCKMCPRNYIEAHKGFITEELWMKLVDDIQSHRDDAIVLPFWRGESLLHPRFAELIRYALKRKIRIHLSTNGHVLDEANARILAECEFVTFSIHTLQGYKNARDFLTSKKEGKPSVQVSFVKGEKSAEELLPKIVSTADLEGFDSVRLYEEHTTDGVFGKSAGSDAAARLYCQKLHDTLVISYDGSISRCNHVWETDRTIDLRATTIHQAWTSSSINEVRQKYPDGYCASCDQWTGHTCGESWRRENHKITYRVYNPRGADND